MTVWVSHYVEMSLCRISPPSLLISPIAVLRRHNYHYHCCLLMPLTIILGFLAVRQHELTISSPPVHHTHLAAAAVPTHPQCIPSSYQSLSDLVRSPCLFMVLSAVTCNHGSQQRSQSFPNGTKSALSISPVTATLKCGPIAIATNHTTVSPTHRASC